MFVAPVAVSLLTTVGAVALAAATCAGTDGGDAMEIIWACAGGMVLMTVVLAFVRARECRRIELMAQTIDD